MQNKSEIISRATNPGQYDLKGVSWEPTIGLESSMRIFIWKYVKKYATNWKGKKILDIGTGSGWLLEEARKLGADRCMGVEPSKNNFEASRKLFPKIEVVNSSFEEFDSKEKYDVIVSILSFSHISDIDAAFKKVSSLLEPRGEFILISMDYDYYKIQRLGYDIRLEDIDENTYAIHLKGIHGELADVVRKKEVFLNCAKKEGLTHLETIPMKPDQELIAAMPQLKEVENHTFFNLIRFIH